MAQYGYRTKHGPHIPRSRATRSSEPSCDVEDDAYPVSHFAPQHGLTPAQVWEAERRLARADRLRPIDTRSYRGLLRWRLRLAGIVSAVKSGRVGNAKWGREMLATRGGLAMKCHAPHILSLFCQTGVNALK
jgi:hypothetical protein